MGPDELHEQAHATALSLPATSCTQPFGPEWDVYKVKGKVFLLLTEQPGEFVATMKVEPSDSEALREQFEEIRPGYHMNKRHWITVKSGPGIDTQLIDDLVTESYLLVVEKNLPRREWPVDPRSFGSGR